MEHVCDFFKVIRLDASKIATLQQEEANTMLYCDDPNCIACQIHLKNLVAKNREILILIDTILRPHKKEFARLFGEMVEIREAGERYVAHVEASHSQLMSLSKFQLEIIEEALQLTETYMLYVKNQNSTTTQGS